MQQRLKLSETADIMMRVMVVLFAVLSGLGLLVILLIYPFEQPLPYLLGLLIGTLLSLIKVYLMDRSIQHAMDRTTSKAAQGYASLQVTLRYLLTLGVFALVFLFKEQVGLFGAILGVLLLQFSAYLSNPILKRRERKKE